MKSNRTRAKRRGNVVRVSDHALLRLLERAGGMDIEAFRATVEMSIMRAVAAAGHIGADQYRVLADGLIYVVRDNVVVTILDDNMPRFDQRQAQPVVAGR